MRKKKNLVIGANSFLAQEIIKRLMLFDDVLGVYNIKTDNLLQKIDYIPMCKFDNLRDDFDIVYLISAYIPPKGDEINKSQLVEVNQKLPKKVVEKFKHAKIIYASSVSVYGFHDVIINEKTKVAPLSDYAASKLIGELEISKHNSYAIIRISSMYGIGMNTSTFIPQIIQSAINKGNIEILGEGKRLQNYIHVSDVADFFVKVSGININNTYLATAEKSTMNIKIAKMVQNLLPTIKINFIGLDNSPSFVYDAHATYEKLNSKPLIRLEDGLKELIKWQQRKF